jgi:hypothetical protein
VWQRRDDDADAHDRAAVARHGGRADADANPDANPDANSDANLS